MTIVLSSSNVGADPLTYSAATNVSDSFQRTAHAGFGTADLGGPYKISSPASLFKTTRGTGQISPIGPGKGVRATLSQIDTTNQSLQLTFSLPRIPKIGGGLYVALEFRRQANGDDYRAKVRVMAGGRLSLSFSKVVNGQETTIGLAYSVKQKLTIGTKVTLEADVLAANPVILHERAYFGSAVPGWQNTFIDDNAPRAIAGSVGIWAYDSVGTPGETLDVHSFRGSALTLKTPSSAPTSSAPQSSTAPSTSVPSTTSSSAPSVNPSSSTSPSTSAPTSPTSPSPSGATPVTPPTTSGAAGSAAPGATSYAIPAGAIFVSPNGSNSGTGSISSPFATVAKAIAAAPSGATIVLRGGTYHESITVPANKVLTIQGYPGEAAWFDGSSVVSSWTQSGNAWVHNGWTAQFDSTAGYTPAIAANTSPNWTWLNPAYPLAAHPDQVWFGGQALTQVASQSQLTAGTFYVNYDSDQLFVGSNPAGQSVRASDTKLAIIVQSAGSVLRGFGVRNYATSVPDMGTVKLMGANDKISNVVITDNATAGLYVRSSGIRVDHVTANDNGLLGISGNYSDNLAITSSVVEGNNAQHFNFAPVSGGIKITRSRGLTVADSVIDNNIGNGLWFDESCYNMVATGNELVGNLKDGMQIELSALGILANNKITNNADDGIHMADTSNFQIWNNTFGANVGRTVELVQDTRTNTPSTAGHDPRQPDPDPTISWITSNIQVMNNLFETTSQYHVYVNDVTGHRTADQMGVTVDGNVFTLATSASRALIGWQLSGSVAGYRTAAAFTAATGQGSHNIDVVAGTSPSAAALASSPGTGPQPLPASVASAIGQATGTRKVGAF